MNRQQLRLPRAELGYVLVAILVCIALVLSRGGPVHRPRALSPPKMREFYGAMTDSEREDRLAAVKKFRASQWSQEDEFFHEQADRVRKYAKVENVAVSSLVESLDVGMHDRWPTPQHTTPVATVIPCRPRLVY